MKAIVLVGGEGTRLRPITETVPKPLVPLMDRPSLDHVLDHLARHGVHEVVLSSSYLESLFRGFIRARKGDPRITWITETEPLGTGGAIVNALEHVEGGPFFGLNGDILTDLDLTRMLEMHVDRGAAATIALTRVDDARPYGLVPIEADGRVVEFREKPAELEQGHINAGTYILEPATLREWSRGRSLSIERDVFPAMIERGHPVFGCVSDAYWIDLGTPERYLQAHFDILEGRVRGEPSYPAPFVADGADVDPRAHLGRRVVVGPGARIGPDVHLEDSVMHAGAVVEAGARVVGSILGPNASVGAGATVAGSALAEGASVAARAVIEGARISAGQKATSGGMPATQQPMG